MQNELISRIIGAMTRSEEGQKQFAIWDWFQGVGLYGLYRCAKATGDKEAESFVKNWFDDQIARHEITWNVNSLSPLLTLTYLYEETKKESYLNILNEGLSYALHELARTPEGGFQHVTIDSMNATQLWADTLYMGALFIARMGVLTGDLSLIAQSTQQFLVHIKYLFDPETGLFFHGYNFDGKTHYAGARWGRANAWIAAALTDFLEITAGKLDPALADYLKGTLVSFAENLARVQDTDGMWHTLLNDPASYAEASATAGICYALRRGISKGLLSEKFASAAERGCEAVMKLVDENGFVNQVSAGTCLRDSLDYYKGIRINHQPYGQSLTLLMLTEF